MDYVIVSWNVLNHETLSDDVKLGTWEDRKKTIISYLLSAPFDFILLQEVELDTFELDFKLLVESFKYLRHVKTKKRTNHFGNVILWRYGILLTSKINTKSLHVKLQFENKMELWISNVHLPATPGFIGFKEKVHHLKSCEYAWQKDANVIVGGDFNDSFQLYDECLQKEVIKMGFIISEEECKKETCKSMRTNIVYNLDHIVSKGNMKTTYIPSEFDVKNIPNVTVPSDHLPVVYTIKQH